jgi:hypothetical protein
LSQAFSRAVLLKGRIVKNLKVVKIAKMRKEIILRIQELEMLKLSWIGSSRERARLRMNQMLKLQKYSRRSLVLKILISVEEKQLEK